MEYIISVIWIGLELLCSIFFSGAFLNQRKRSAKRTIIVIVAWCIMGIYANLGIDQLVKQLLTVMTFATVSAVLYEGNLLLHLALDLICYIFIAATDAIVINGMCRLLDVSYNTFVWRKLSFITLTTADKLLAIFLTWLLQRFRKKGNLGKQHSKWIQLSILFPAASAVMLAILFYSSPRDEDVSLGIVAFAGILVIANIAILYVINNIEKSTEQEHALRMLRQQISIQTDNYSALQKNYSVQRKSTHEFERHVQVIKDLLEQQEYSTAQDYVKQLQNNRTLRIFSISSHNPVVDVVLNQKYQVAQENGIKMVVRVNDLSDIAIQTNDLVVLLSNLLDNAIEACEKVITQKEIVCSVLKEDNLYISIRNTSLPVETAGGEIPTTKHNATEHGYGLQAVRYILRESNAEYTFTYNNGWFLFSAEIPQ